MDNILEVYDEDCLQTRISEEKVNGREGEEAEALPGREEQQEIGVSVHALSREIPQDTIKIRGETNNRDLTILIDTRSTHSFIDLQVGKEMGAKMEAASPLTVTVANGHKVLSKLRCPGFSWVMQGQPFQTDLRVIRIEGSNMVLGIDWLKSYGLVTFDFSSNSVVINKKGQRLELKGIEEGATLRLISAAQWKQEVGKGKCYLLRHQGI